MKSIVAIAIISIIVLGFIASGKPAAGQKEIRTINGTYTPVAVLELFTSEGCSSCPPADNLLPQLAKSDSNIIPLSFHVDYWNRLGWTDPFSKGEYSDRQRDYSRQFNLESVYTPQLVVNGAYELVGSNRGKAETTVKTALKTKASVEITVSHVELSNGKLKFVTHTEGNVMKSDLLAAVVQKHAMINIKAGENSGATLSHTNVVRSFSKQAATGKNEFELRLPENLATDNWQLIVYTQQKNDLKITGAVVYKPDQQ